MQNAECRGLVLLVLDTLRADAATWSTRSGALARLAGWTAPLQRLVCGSFPTVPMRTDLLTGRLSFLHRRWAIPQAWDEVLTRAMRNAGVRTTMVTDNYVLSVPELGGDITPWFDQVHAIRGNGSDPFAACHRDGPTTDERPTRSRQFDLQYAANVAGWNGASPTDRLFTTAAQVLDRAGDAPFFVWVDCFAPHEPWVTPAAADDDEPFWPPYGDATAVTSLQIESMRRRYAERIASVERAMAPFVEALAGALATGDVALAVLSDHGFYFGEFGLLGKPKSHPLLPPLFELVGRLSPHFESLFDFGAPLQPHDLTPVLARLLGARWETRTPQCTTRLIGRNSEESSTVTLLSDDRIMVAWRDALARQVETVAYEALQSDLSWDAQCQPLGSPPELPPTLRETPWLTQFSRLWAA